MNIQGRILQSLRPRKDGILLRSDVSSFGSASQISVALKCLLEQGLLVKLGRGIYAKPEGVRRLGGQALLEQALLRVANQQASKIKRTRLLRSNSTASYVYALAKREGIVFVPTFADRWAQAVTHLAGDEVKSDPVDDMLVALARAGRITPRDMTKLVIAHHRDLAHV